MKPLVSIIILTYNHLEETMITIDCFKQQDYENLNIIVVDNASWDDTCSYIKRNHPEVTLIENKENLGWASGNNIGIKYALEHSAEYILLANNDLFFDDNDILSILMKNMEEFAPPLKVGMIGTRQYSYFHQDKLMSEGIFYFSKSERRNQSLNIYRNQNKFILPKNFKKVDAIIGAFLLIKRELFNEVGLIDDDYYFTWEDTDLCYRAWKQGYICLVNEDLKIYHKASTSCKINSAFSMYYRTRNLFMFQKKHRKTIPDYLFYIFIYYYKFLKQIARIIIFPSRLSDSRTKVLKAAFNGFFDAVLFNRKGKRY